MSYLWDQGTGQFDLFWRGRPNVEVLADPDVSEEVKAKIQLIEKYKSYFYKYWGQSEGGIYSETTILEEKAVSYLVIASPYDRISPLEHSFPFFGRFPYLGFFSSVSARDYAQSLEKEKWVTYIRPVYAYSTLGYFEDNILSSFFHFDAYGLAELIFHELFHTLFFIENEVSLNESLATYFSRQMLYEYFEFKGREIKERMESLKKRDLLMGRLVGHIQKLDEIYAQKAPLHREYAKSILDNYIKKDLYPDMELFCKREEIKDCFPLKLKWNNASLAAFMTYEEKEKRLEKLHKKKGGGLREFFFFIKKRYQFFLEKKGAPSFSDDLFGSMNEI